MALHLSRRLTAHRAIRQLIHRNVHCVLILVCVCVQCSCAPLLALPFQVLSLPVYAFKFIGSLLPLALKYAPLALLFIDNNKEQPLYYASLPDGVMRVYATDARVCFVVPLETDAQKGLVERAAADQRAHIVFVRDASLLGDVRDLQAVDEDMKDQAVQYAYDANVLKLMRSHDVVM